MMIAALKEILWDSWRRLGAQVAQVLPNILAMLLILAAGWILGRVVQWSLERMSARLEQSLRRLGVEMVMDSFGRSNAARLIARGGFWVIFGCAVLMGIDTLHTEIGTRAVSSLVGYFPSLFTGGLLILAGLWLGRFLARGVLIWAVNEGIGPARWLASGVRAGVGMLAVVAAAEQLGVARVAALATLIILLSGAVLAAALAIGLGCRKRVEQWLDQRAAFLEAERRDSRLEHL